MTTNVPAITMQEIEAVLTAPREPPEEPAPCPVSTLPAELVALLVKQRMPEVDSDQYEGAIDSLLYFKPTDSTAVFTRVYDLLDALLHRCEDDEVATTMLHALRVYHVSNIAESFEIE